MDTTNIQQVTVYNKKQFIEYNSKVDSIYQFHIVKIGVFTGKDFVNAVTIAENQFGGRDKWYCYRISFARPSPFSLFSSFYNVIWFPNAEINSISMYFEGQILSKEIISDNLIVYSIDSYNIAFSFNNQNISDLSTTRMNLDALPIRKVLFYRDKDNVLYIINIATVNGTDFNIREITSM